MYKKDGSKYFQGNSSLDPTNSSLEAEAIALLTAVQQLGRLSYKHAKEIEDNNNEGVITTFRHSLDSIPLDLISDILLKFPAKSLVEFTCVSNTWYSIIRTQMFIKTFMSMSISRPRILLTFKRWLQRK
ncbi:unnamed protein product [Brassica oleracea]